VEIYSANAAVGRARIERTGGRCLPICSIRRRVGMSSCSRLMAGLFLGLSIFLDVRPAAESTGSVGGEVVVAKCLVARRGESGSRLLTIVNQILTILLG